MDKHQYERIVEIAFKLNSNLSSIIQSQIFEEGLRELRNRTKNILHRKILLIGGAGYIGSTVTHYLLQCGYHVRVLDLLLYQNHHCILPYLSHKNYEFINGDFTSITDLQISLNGVTDVVILAGLVGDPITKKHPEVSEYINYNGMVTLFNNLKKYNLNKVIFISTCSNYGLIEKDILADENWDLKPLSSYAKAKVQVEKLILSQKGHVSYFPTILRFATAFGISSRMRFDLTVNEFVREIFLGKPLVVYDSTTWRPYCHVLDFALIIRLVLEAPINKINFEVFNAGSEKNNFTKQMIIDEIKHFVPNAQVNYQQHGSDPRNYRVNFKKIKEKLLFEAQYQITDGIKEIIGALKNNLFNDIDHKQNLYGNYLVNYPFVINKAAATNLECSSNLI